MHNLEKRPPGWGKEPGSVIGPNTAVAVSEKKVAENRKTMLASEPG